MKKIILIIGIFTFLIGCESDNIEKKDYPSCFQNFINETLSSSAGTPRARIDKYNFENSIVYVFQHDHADPISIVYDKNCEVICDFGGITQENSCNNWDTAEFIENVWTDNR